MIQLFVSFEFYIKNIYLFFFFILIKSDKQVNMIDSFNKWVVIRLRNFDPFNKHDGLMLIYIIGYS